MGGVQGLAKRSQQIYGNVKGQERGGMMVSEIREVVVRPGLEGVIAAETELSSVDGLNGELIIAGYRLEEFASCATFEDVVYLLWRGKLGNEQELRDFGAGLSTKRWLPEATVRLLAEIAVEERPVIDALRMGVATLDLGVGARQARELAEVTLARIPTLIATYWNMRKGKPVIEPSETLSHVGNYLYMLTGQEPAAAQVRALETYFNTVVDHGLNASTFTARVIIATESDLVSAVTGAIGALKGPLHGGAPGPALDMVKEIGVAENAEVYLRAKLEKGERLMGFGHRVYKVRDPRAMVLADAAERLFDKAGRSTVVRTGKISRIHGNALACRIQAWPDAADECGVLYGIAARWNRAWHGTVYADFCGCAGRRLDCTLH